MPAGEVLKDIDPSLINLFTIPHAKHKTRIEALKSFPLSISWWDAEFAAISDNPNKGESSILPGTRVIWQHPCAPKLESEGKMLEEVEREIFLRGGKFASHVFSGSGPDSQDYFEQFRGTRIDDLIRNRYRLLKAGLRVTNLWSYSREGSYEDWERMGTGLIIAENGTISLRIQQYDTKPNRKFDQQALIEWFSQLQSGQSGVQ